MNVYEVVFERLARGYGPGARFTVDGVAQFLAPIIEKGLRVAVEDALDYENRQLVHLDREGCIRGCVTAGVAAMVEGS